MDQRPIENCYWVEPGQFLAGEYPRNKDLESSEAKIQALVEAGVTAFIDLTEADEDLGPYAQLLEAYEDRGVTHQRFPIRDYSLPESTEFTRSVLDAIDRNLDAGKMVYIHCWGGVGRTGTIVGCWLARHGESGQAALDQLSELWRQCPKSRFQRSPESRDQERYILGWNE